MTRDECLDELRAHCVGRVSVTHQALPVIMPVNYVLDAHGIIFRTRGDGLLANACRSNVVAFEIDHLADDGSNGWSVLVVGVANALADSELLRASSLALVSAAGDDRDHFVRISLGQVTGRRVGVTATPTTAA
jgi:nitroimidazol reductase NimA-like FMN-containing flavoprotein (pyridoxamine 5'-phosphate oxidase superfamily)